MEVLLSRESLVLPHFRTESFFSFQVIEMEVKFCFYFLQ